MDFPENTVTALIGQACGDSFGAAFEFHENAPALAEQSVKEQRYLTWKDTKVPLPHRRTAGLYTDDTQQSAMLLWIWGQMVDKGRDPVSDPGMVGGLFHRVAVRMAQEQLPGSQFGVHRGTGRNFREFVKTGRAPDTAGLGAAMRIGPVGTLFRSVIDPGMKMPEHLFLWATVVSGYTTCNAIALEAAAFFAQLAWSLTDDRVEPVGRWCFEDFPDGPFRDAYNVLQNEGEASLLKHVQETKATESKLACASSGFALTGLVWVAYQVEEATSFEDALLRVCASGGDTDTVAAMAGCLAALRFGREAIPEWMTAQLVGIDHILHPETWHPIAVEREYVDMDRKLRNTSVSASKPGRPQQSRKRHVR